MPREDFTVMGHGRRFYHRNHDRFEKKITSFLKSEVFSSVLNFSFSEFFRRINSS